MAHWRSWSGLASARPAEVVRPRTLAEARAALATAAERGQAVRVQGAGTACDGSTAGSADVLLDTTRLTGLAPEEDPRGDFVTALAGTRNADLVAAVAALGRALPAVVPFAEATVGGMLATGADGSSGRLRATPQSSAAGSSDNWGPTTSGGPILAARLVLTDPYQVRVRQRVVDFEEAIAELATDPDATVLWLPSAPLATLRHSTRVPLDDGPRTNAPAPYRGLRALRAGLRATPVLGQRLIERAARRQPAGEGTAPWFADAVRPQRRAVWADWRLPRELSLPALRALRTALLASPELSPLPLALRSVPGSGTARQVSVGVRAPLPGAFERYFDQVAAALSAFGARATPPSWPAPGSRSPHIGSADEPPSWPAPDTPPASPGAAPPPTAEPLRD